MYFWLTTCRAFHSWGQCSNPRSVLKSKKKKAWGHFLAPLIPDAVLHSLKSQSTLQRGNASCGHRRVRASPHSLTI